MRNFWIAVLIVLSCSCSDNTRNNPLDPGSANSIIGSITGTVLPANSNPLVQLRYANNVLSSQSVAGNGYFEFNNLKEALYSIVIQANSYNMLTLDNVAVIGKENSNLGSLVLTPSSIVGDTSAPRAIFGKVTDSKSQTPIENAQISAIGLKTYATSTNSSGAFSIVNVDSGQYNVTALKQGYLVSTTTVKVGKSGGVQANYSLGPIGVVQGKVRDALTGNPLANVLIQIGGFSAYSNSSGDYIISGGQDQITASVSFTVSQYITLTQAVGIIPGSITPLNVQLVKYGTVSGKVTNASTGAAIVGISIVSNYSAGTSDGNGNYIVTVIPGSVTLRFNGTGYVTQSIAGISVSSGGVIVQNVSMQLLSNATTGTVGGTIRDALSGQGISSSYYGGLEIFLEDVGQTKLYGYDLDTIPAGVYSLKNIDNSSPLYNTPNFLQGDYSLQVFGPFLSANGYLPINKTITITAGNNVFNVTLVKGATIVGTVVDALTNRNVGNASLSIGTLAASTDLSGTFRLNPVDPSLSTLTISASGYYTSTQTVVLQSNQTIFISVALVPLPTISGTVIDSATGIGLSNVRVEMGSTFTYSATNGSYMMQPLSAGSGILSFAKSGYKSYVTAVAVPRSGNVIVNAVLASNP